MRMFQVQALVGEPCRPSSIRKSTALRRRRFQGRILGTIPGQRMKDARILHPSRFALAPVVKWDHGCLSNSSTGIETPSGRQYAAQAQVDVHLSCKQRAAGSRPASGSSGWGVPRPRGRTHSSLVEQHAVNVLVPGSNPGVLPQGRTPPAQLARTHPNTRACSAAGSAPQWHCGGRGFEPRRVHHRMTAYPNGTGVHAS